MYDEFELMEVDAEGVRDMTPEDYREQGYDVPLPVPMPADNLEGLDDLSFEQFEPADRPESDDLQFFEPEAAPVAEEPEKKKGKKKKKKRSPRLNTRTDKEKAPYTEAPKGDWSEFSSARVTDEDKKTGPDGGGDGDERNSREAKGRRGANITDTYTVVEKAEFEKIDISRAEARGTIRFKDLKDMCVQFSRIHESGVSVIDTVRILIEQTADDDLREALENIHRDIKGGEDLSTAMSNCACFPFAFTIAVSAAEKNDMVALAFKRFAVIFEREDECREMDKSSVFYPALTTVCSLVVMIIMMLVVYPGFVDMFSGLDTELPQLSRALLSLASSFKQVWWMLLIIIVLILLTIFIYKKASSADLLGPTLGERSLPAGSYKRMNVYAKFARYMNALLEVGVATKDALFVTAHSFTEYPFLTARLLDAANASAAGSTLSNALCVFDFFPMMILQMISVGEEMGDTPAMLMHVAQYYEDEARKDAAKRSARKEPVSIVIMAVVVLFLLLSMLQPMLRFYELVKQL